MNIYFDSAASTQLDDRVIEAVQEAMRTNFANPSSSHASGKRAKETIETCRIKIANHFGAEPSEIVFTSCGTEANNLTLRYFLKDLGVTRIISSEIEHKSIWITAKLVAEEENIEICYVKVNNKGHVDLQHLEELLQTSDKTTLVTLMHANNEIGTLLPLQEVGDLCKANKAYFHSDTVQTIGHYPLNFKKLGLDFAACSAHKIHGPKGIGFIYMNKNLTLKPMIVGGGQERGMRAGTENIAGICGMQKALELSYGNLEKDKEYVSGLKKLMLDGLHKLFGNQIKINGDVANSLYTMLSVSFPNNVENGSLLFKLDEKGIAVSGGSACNSELNQGSHVLNQIYTNSSEYIPIRFSFSKFNTKEEVHLCLQELKQLVKINILVS